MNAQATELVAIGDDTIEAMRDDSGRIWVVVRRMCEVVGVDVPTQRQRLMNQPWAVGHIAMSPIRDSMGRTQTALMIDDESVPMWLATLDGARVRAEAKEKIARFQIEARGALASHFGMGWSGPSHRQQGSGGAQGSGGVPTTEKSSVVGGVDLDALEHVNNVLTGLLRAARSQQQEVAAVRADLSDHKTLVEEKTRVALEASQRALAAAHDAAAVADRTARAGAQSREHRRRIDAAVGTITSAIRQWCTKTGTPYQKAYSAVRADLGLRRTQDGGPALGRAKLRADQALRFARTATEMGVPGVGAAVINAILNGEDTPAPLPPARLIPPRADDIEVKS